MTYVLKFVNFTRVDLMKKPLKSGPWRVEGRCMLDTRIPSISGLTHCEMNDNNYYTLLMWNEAWLVLCPQSQNKSRCISRRRCAGVGPVCKTISLLYKAGNCMAQCRRSICVLIRLYVCVYVCMSLFQASNPQNSTHEHSHQIEQNYWCVDAADTSTAMHCTEKWNSATWQTRITLSLQSASQGTSPAYWSWRLITLTWSHTHQFVISFITTVTIHYSSLPLQAQNSSFPQILSSIVLLPFHSPAWLQLFFVLLGHVGFNFGTVC